MEFTSCLAKQKNLKSLLASCTTPDQLYAKIIELGRSLPPFPEDQKIPAHLVKGCQSQMYLISSMKEGKIYFSIHSDALISAGLGALLLAIYDGEPPQALLLCPPTVLKELNLPQLLSPGRANGLASLFAKMREFAQKALL